MQKRTPDYDNVFKTMKSKHRRLFVPVVNDTFGKAYPMDVNVEMLPSEGYLTESETLDGSKKIAEYVFIVARQFATWDIGHAVVSIYSFLYCQI